MLVTEGKSIQVHPISVSTSHEAPADLRGESLPNDGHLVDIGMLNRFASPVRALKSPVSVSQPPVAQK